MQGLQEKLEQFTAAESTVLAISPDSVAMNRRLSEKLKLEFPLLSDAELTAIDLYGLRHVGAGFGETADTARPAVFIIDRRGTIRYRNLTENWRIRPRPEQLLEQIAALP